MLFFVLYKEDQSAGVYILAAASACFAAGDKEPWSNLLPSASHSTFLPMQLGLSLLMLTSVVTDVSSRFGTGLNRSKQVSG